MTIFPDAGQGGGSSGGNIQSNSVIAFTDHFITEVNQPLFSNHTNGGGGVAYNQYSDAGHLGTYKIQTGGGTGQAAITTNEFGLTLGLGSGYITWVWKVDALSTGGDAYTARVGALKGAGSATGDPTDGIFIRYTHSVNSGNMQLVCRANGTETAIDLGVAVVAGTWYNTKISFDAVGASVTAQVNGGTPSAAITTNIPNSQFRTFGVASSIDKTSGSTNVAVWVDMCDFLMSLTTPL